MGFYLMVAPEVLGTEVELQPLMLKALALT